MPMENFRHHAGMVRSVARIMLLPSWAIAFGIMLKGYADVGDGFSAGVIAALSIILQGLAFGTEELDRIVVARLAPVLAFVGLGLAFAVAFVPVLFGDPLMTHWPPSGDKAYHFGVLEFITPVLFDVAVFLVVYGFCVGAVHAIGREEARKIRMIERLSKKRRGGK